MRTDKPTPPDGYEVMQGSMLPIPVPAGTQEWSYFPELGEVGWNPTTKSTVFHVDTWYAVPVKPDEPLTMFGYPATQADLDKAYEKIIEAPLDPKKAQGAKKPQLQLIPPALNVATVQALQNGAEKYGTWNWRENRVEMMTYLGAIRRHLDDLLEGENFAPDSGVHHLGHIAANCAILLDAEKHGMLVDNRPPSKSIVF